MFSPGPQKKKRTTAKKPLVGNTSPRKSPPPASASSSSSASASASSFSAVHKPHIRPKKYYTSNETFLTEEQALRLPSHTLVIYKRSSEYPNFKRDYFYTILDKTNSGFGFLFDEMLEMEAKRAAHKGGRRTRRNSRRNSRCRCRRNSRSRQSGGDYNIPTVPTRGISLYEPVTQDAVVSTGTGTMSLKEYLNQQGDRELAKLQLGTPQ